MNKQRKTALAVALGTVIGTSTSASAEVIDLEFNGWFTLMDPTGSSALYNVDVDGAPYYGWRTPVSGSMSFDTNTGAGSAYMSPFTFFGGGFASVTGISFQAVGDGMGSPGPLMLGNMGFNWHANLGIPISIVLDASGLYTAVQGGLSAGDTVSGVGALPASDDLVFVNFKTSYTLPIGAAPMATTTWNTTDIGTIALGTNPSGTLPFTDDGIGGSPMKEGPFPGFNANFDITFLRRFIIEPPIPVPAAIWLFGSGLTGLIGVARRKNRA